MRRRRGRDHGVVGSGGGLPSGSSQRRGHPAERACGRGKRKGLPVQRTDGDTRPSSLTIGRCVGPSVHANAGAPSIAEYSRFGYERSHYGNEGTCTVRPGPNARKRLPLSIR
jgi:hypothetical protein